MPNPPLHYYQARAVQRECRGLLVSGSTGEVIARRFPKFFNLNERDESQLHTIQATVPGGIEPGVCKEKLDGMLCSAVLLTAAAAASADANGRVVWCTRRCRSDAIERFVADRPAYSDLARWALASGATPIFEWCPKAHVCGVLRHTTSHLVLLELRDNVTGRYHVLLT